MKLPSAIDLTKDDVSKIVAARMHLGTTNINSGMEQYIFGRRPDGVHIFDSAKTWNKLILAIRALVTVPNPSDIVVVSSRKFGQRAVLKFAKYTGAYAIAGKFVPGTFTNCLAKGYKEPAVVIITDPEEDSQAIAEAALVNVPVIAFCDTNSPLKNVDIAIPCSRQSKHSIGLGWYFLAREFLFMTGRIPRAFGWDVMVDMFFYRDPEEVEKEQENARLRENAALPTTSGAIADAPMVNDMITDEIDMGAAHQTDNVVPMVSNWAA